MVPVCFSWSLRLVDGRDKVRSCLAADEKMWLSRGLGGGRLAVRSPLVGMKELFLICVLDRFSKESIWERERDSGKNRLPGYRMYVGVGKRSAGYRIWKPVF